MKEVNELIKKLPSWVHLKKEPFSCPHCGKAYDLNEKPVTTSAYSYILLNGDHWIVRYSAQSHGVDAHIQFIDKDLRVAIKKMLAYIEEHKEELRPYYESNT